MTWQLASELVLAGVLVAGAVTEVRDGKVYNWLTYPAVVVGLLLGLAAGWAEGDVGEVVLNRLAGLGLGFGVLFLAFMMGGMGGGDVKLMAAVGAFLGWPGTLHAVFYSFLVAAVIGLVGAVRTGRLGQLLRRIGWAVRLMRLPGARLDEAAPEETLRVPFGLAVCIGTLWAVVELEAGATLWDVVFRAI